jgi:hypothetical protein
MRHLLPNFPPGHLRRADIWQAENHGQHTAHQQLAVEVGTAGTVLLKNKGNVLRSILRA